MGHKILLAIILLILSIGITPAFAIQPTDVDTECRLGQTLVHRTVHGDFICTSDSTANRWVELGLAELIEEFVTEEISKELTQDFTIFNVTPDSIVVHQADVEDLVLPIVPDEFRDAEVGEPNYTLPQWLEDAEIKVPGVTE